MTGVLNVPNDDRFMVITEHEQADLVISPEYLGIGHTADVMLIQVTRNEGRTVPVKWDFYRAVADGLHERTGLSSSAAAATTRKPPPACFLAGLGQQQRFPRARFAFGEQQTGLGPAGPASRSRTVSNSAPCPRIGGPCSATASTKPGPPSYAIA